MFHQEGDVSQRVVFAQSGRPENQDFLLSGLAGEPDGFGEVVHLLVLHWVETVGILFAEPVRKAVEVADDGGRGDAGVVQCRHRSVAGNDDGGLA